MLHSIPLTRGNSSPGTTTALAAVVLVLLASVLDQSNVHQNLLWLSLSMGLAAAVALLVVVRLAGGRWEVGAGGAVLALLAAWSGLGIGWSAVPYLSVPATAALAATLAVYAAWRSLAARHPAAIQTLQTALIGLGVVMALFMLGQVILGERPRAFFLNPNNAAGYLNLLWPTAAVLWLARAEGDEPALRRGGLGLAAMALMVFTAVFDGSRAALLAAGTAMAVLAIAGWQGWRRPRATSILLVVFATALLAAHFAGDSQLGERMATLGDPTAAGSTRFAIWAGTWELIRENPWLGLGPGVFWMAYPAVRRAADGSDGYFAHNDLLGFWAEHGLPGPLLLLALAVLCTALFVRLLRHLQAGNASHPGAGIAAFSALAATGVHSLFSYPLQLLSFLLILALLLAQLEFASGHRIGSGPLPRLDKPIRRIGVIATTALIALSLFLMGDAQRWTERAGEHAAAGDYDRADEAYERAIQRWGLPDPPWYQRAAMYQRVAEQLPEEDEALRRSLLEEALGFLDKAEERNPLRARIPAIRATLYRQHPDGPLANPEPLYQEALRRNPRAVRVRIAYAKWLESHGRSQEARQLVEEGTELRYGSRVAALAIHGEAFRTRREAGEEEAARAMRQRIREMTP